MRIAGHNKTRDKIFKYIHEFFDNKGYAPTVREILKGCGISSTAVVQHHLDVLEREGKIHRDPEIFRSIRLADKPDKNAIPVLGSIAAGQPLPVLSEDTINTAAESINVPPEITSNKKAYALRVKGQSMIDALIDDGDIVIMEPCQTVNNGDMAAVWLKNECSVTLKRVHAESSRVILKPANQTMKPMIHSPENVEIQGRVIGVMRKLK